ncbi:glycosyltransferase family 4 protein [Candidatus Methylopumilus universalis]|uniref:Glycosyltransferase family 4 protein n=1 Tax=Candidatus Methylopumilus universalis TaxID=2588536 RepID=A0AAX1EZQ2_9PROT|nr:glycosyltransferase family 4 protein [Candidatus Methylopumilus universalis]QDC41239.1 glycosyltransferase family 4 protein [Candidatus Methylopumilus universalis]QDC42529.1 glycosyltransferase family 4 protein [Candidatus Methylopumilus universalis]QDC54915.1 glycosyltransferase family 4 protein [Candidatus Methylopumilus universalis]QDC56196.1 glycosyltransferase family 4 protein [Candidatus Methylopumilus universalis]QDC57478.1 glycosyltransferase family 4 protein [Candidatus Methylopumi
MNNNILIVSQYFYPEHFIINDFAIALAEQGANISVLTSNPSYPAGSKYKKYKSYRFVIENYQGVTVYRIPSFPRVKNSFLSLSLTYLSFVFNASIFGFFLFLFKKIDCILVFAPSPITAAIPAIPLKFLKKATLFIWIQDLWPESVISSGYVKNNIFLRLLTGVVKLIYKQADLLLIQSKSFLPYVKKLTSTKMVYFPNSIKRLIYKEHSLPKKLRLILNTNFCIVYAGNVGFAQDLKTLVTAAELLAEHKMIKILIVGGGSDSLRIKKMIIEKKLKNIHFFNRLPFSSMAELFFFAKGLYIGLKDEKHLNVTIPGKFQAYLAASRPIIVSSSGLISRIVKKNKLGFVCDSSDSEKLASIILKLYNLNDTERFKVGERAYDFFQANYDMNFFAKKLLSLFTQISQKSKKR